MQSLLNAHPNAVCMHELAKPNARPQTFRRYYVGRRRSLIRLMHHDPVKYVNQLIGSLQPKWVHAIGFKLLYTVAPDPVLAALTEIDDLRIVRITRSHFRSAISFAIARQSGAWVGRMPDALELDPHYVRRRMEIDIAHEERALGVLENKEMLTVHFEEFVKDLPGHLTVVQEFLGLPQRELRPQIRRQTPDVRQVVRNYDDLCEALGRSALT